MLKSLPPLLASLLPALSRCHACLAITDSAALCPACDGHIPRAEYACSQCALPLPQAATRCGGCQSRPPAFDRAEAACLYADPVSHWVTRLKFGHDLSYARLMAETLREPLQALRPLRARSVLLAVPLHRQRLRQRGFNQSYELTRHLARHSGIALQKTGLVRHKATARQTTLSKAQRQKNVRGAFRVTATDWPAHVILVDDVITTGNTLHECARVLKKAGVQRVDALVFARA